MLFAGTRKPSTATARMAPILRTVIRFCTAAPCFRPKWLTAVRTRIAATAVTWTPERFQVQPPIVCEASTLAVEENGKNAPRYSPKPTAIAAMPPDIITRKQDQP